MNKIDELEDFVISALRVSKHGLYQWQIEQFKRNTKSKQINNILDDMNNKLNRFGYCDQTPGEMWSEHFPADNVNFEYDLFDLHSMYYYWVDGELRKKYADIFSSQEWSQKELIALGILFNIISSFFIIPEGYKKGLKSNYFRDSSIYSLWKDNQFKLIEILYKEIKNLNKFIQKEN